MTKKLLPNLKSYAFEEVAFDMNWKRVKEAL